MSNTTSQSTFPHDTGDPTAANCCGGPAPEGAGACCVRDAEVKASGGSGCGCNSGSARAPKPAPTRSGCCG